nr:bifunctional indole-3-glycerol-phosphate synthase TrpC/phosphoribosylanthranilate isomerase TrpF [uncultured Moellerella sp.]
MKATVLQQIVDDKYIALSARKTAQPLDTFIDKVVPTQRDFYGALSAKRPVFILECKKASPSKGVIRTDFDPANIAKTYQPYAAVISVLTDEKYFQGDFAYLTQVSQAVHQPVLCKDFIVDEYQIYLARHYQADAILLMLSVLSNQEYLALAAVANKLNMGILTEVSNPDELARAIELKARVVGINNRDLRDLSIDLNRTRELAPQLPQGTIIISESGIYQRQQIQQLSQFVNGFLIGSALMSQDNLEQALKTLIFGEHKVCGLTRGQDALAAYQAGASYGGLIFAEKSPRKVTVSQAQAVIHAAPLKYVGVFQYQSSDFIAHIANTLALMAVQLQGNEDDAFIEQLRTQLAESCQIWRALDMSKAQPHQFNHPAVARLVLDNGSGGTGQSFDWSLIPAASSVPLMIAGGLNAQNCQQAAQHPCNGLDFNSGLETEAGIKSHEKIKQVFTLLAS